VFVTESVSKAAKGNDSSKQTCKRRYAPLTGNIKAWALAKADGLRIRVRVTTLRQETLQKLAKLCPDDVTVQLRREPRNSHDKNAVTVYAAAPICQGIL